MESIKAILSNKTFESNDGDFHIYQLLTASNLHAKAVYSGYNAPVAGSGFIFVLRGEWVSHNRHGRQFHIKKWERIKSYHDSVKDSHGKNTNE